jgi:hypothetical protein
MQCVLDGPVPTDHLLEESPPLRRALAFWAATRLGGCFALPAAVLPYRDLLEVGELMNTRWLNVDSPPPSPPTSSSDSPCVSSSSPPPPPPRILRRLLVLLLLLLFHASV